MKNRRFILFTSIILIFLITFSQCVIADTKYNTLTDEQKLEDLNFLYEKIKDGQPHLNKKLFEDGKKYIESNISSLNDVTFNYEISKFLAKSKDSHTSIWGPNAILQPIIPISQIINIDDKWYIAGISTEYKKYLGNEIIAINSVPINDILELAKPYISYDNETYLKTSFGDKIIYAEFLKYIGVIKNTDVIPIKLKDSNETVYTVKIKTSSERYSAIFKDTVSFPISETKNNSERYRFYNLDDETIVIQCNQCMKDKEKPLAEFQKNIKNQISNKEYKKVIFDLRFNKGGDYPSFKILTDTVIDLMDTYNYKTYALIGSGTFSAGVMMAVDLKEGGAVLVGTPTAGNVNFYANTQNFKLPNSGFQGMYSTGYVEMIPEYDKGGLYPDIDSQYTINNYLNGEDKDINIVLKQ